jgi:hypothetical protein
MAFDLFDRAPDDLLLFDMLKSIEIRLKVRRLIQGAQADSRCAG